MSFLFRHSDRATRRAAWAIAATLVGGAGCSPEAGLLDVAPLGPAGTEALEAVQVAFPEQASTLTRSLGAFAVATGDDGAPGFDLVEPSGRALPTEAWLPRRAGEAMRLSFREGFELRVTERGTLGEGKLANGVVSYARAGGTAFWHGSAAGAEEWLYLPEGSPATEVATWRVEGGTLRQHGRAVDVYDADGNVQVTVAAPSGYGADGSDVPLRLVVRDDSVVLTIEAPTHEALFLDPVWVSAGSMATARQSHKATLLSSGKVLVAGGGQNSGLTVLSVAELYDTATGTWAPTTSMAKQRALFTMTLLDNGDVLAVGGSYYGNTAEVYEESSETWMSTPLLSQSHAAHVAALLVDGTVLIAGGYIAAEIYTPSTNTWSTVSSPIFTKAYHAATPLPSGAVLAAGGTPNGENAEVYDPGSGSWSAVAAMQVDRRRPVGLSLLDGRSILVGGYKSSSKADVEIYDPVTATWTPASSMAYGRDLFDGVLFSDGGVLAVGGVGGPNGAGYNALSTTELYDPSADVWSPGPSLAVPRDALTTTLLPNDRVLAAGGSDFFNDLATAEILMGTGAIGAPCSWNIDCSSAHCSDGFCCDSACSSGPCDACAVFLGAVADGTCTPLTGTPCDDGNACTQVDSCQAGTCVAGNPVICPAPQECYQPGSCDPAIGTCTNSASPNGTPCVGGTCQAGACVPSMGQGGGGAGGGGGMGGTGGQGGASASGGAGGASVASGAGGGEGGNGGAAAQGGGDVGGASSTGGGGGSAAAGGSGRTAGSGGSGGAGGGGASTGGGALGGGGSVEGTPDSKNPLQSTGCACRFDGSETETPWRGVVFLFALGGLIVRRRARAGGLEHQSTSAGSGSSLRGTSSSTSIALGAGRFVVGGTTPFSSMKLRSRAMRV